MKVKKKLKYILPFFLSLQILNSTNLNLKAMKLNKEINNAIYGTKKKINEVKEKAQNKLNETKSELNKVKNKVEKTKEQIQKNKEQVQKNNEELKNEVEKNEEKLQKEITQIFEETTKNPKDTLEKIKFDNGQQNLVDPGQSDKVKVYNFNDNLCIPIGVDNSSPYVKAIVTDIVYNKIKDSNLLDKEIFEFKDLDSSYNLISILLNENFKPQINLYIPTNKEELEKKFNEVKNTVNGEEFKNFVKNIKITEKDYNEAKDRINKFIEKAIETGNKNIKNLENKDQNIVVVSCYFHDDKNKKTLENRYNHTEIFYKNFLEGFLKSYDEKLNEKINARILNSKFDKAFFNSCYDNIIKLETDSIKEDIEKLNDVKKKFNSNNILKNEIENLKISSSNLEQNSSYGNYKQRIILHGVTDMLGMKELILSDLSAGCFNALKMSKDEQEQFLNYYKDRLRKVEQSGDEFYRTPQLKDFYYYIYGPNSKFVNYLKTEKLDDKTRAKNAENFQHTAKDLLHSVKSVIIEYYKDLIKLVENNLKNKNYTNETEKKPN